jgi:hypothetical protein
MARGVLLLTPAARRLSAELISELSTAAINKGMSRSQAEGQISGILCDIWNSVESKVLAKLPEEDGSSLTGKSSQLRAMSAAGTRDEGV